MKPRILVGVLLLAAQAAWSQSVNLSEGLVAYFPFENPVFDQSPQPSPVTVHGDLEFQPGLRGLAAVFNGKTWLEAADKPAYELERFSFAVWVYHFRPNLRGRIFERGKSDGYYMYIESDRVTTGFFDQKYQEIVANKPMPEESWTFLCATYDGEMLRFYKDGKLIEEQKAKGKPWRKSAPLFIGAKQDGAGYDYLTGALDELRIYNRALSPAEVSQLFAQENP